MGDIDHRNQVAMMNLVYTNSTQSDFQKLCLELEKELFERDGDLADVNYEINKAGYMENAVVLYIDGLAVGCGAFRNYTGDAVEIKRMYVIPSYRRNNVASEILAALENSSRIKGFKEALLETGKNQPEAIAFYLKHGYAEIEKFGGYVDSENSICFKKLL